MHSGESCSLPLLKVRFIPKRTQKLCSKNEYARLLLPRAIHLAQYFQQQNKVGATLKVAQVLLTHPIENRMTA